MPQTHPHCGSVGIRVSTTIALTCVAAPGYLLTLSRAPRLSTAVPQKHCQSRKESVALPLLLSGSYKHLLSAEPNQKQPQGCLRMYLARIGTKPKESSSSSCPRSTRTLLSLSFSVSVLLCSNCSLQVLLLPPTPILL